MKRYKPSSSELKNEMINNLIFLQEQKEMLWLYHPSNMEGLNLIAEYEKITEQISDLELEIDKN
tara:strand:+ start:2448 stop:2639 length:192 start_codon:yes stop_codon:yes gene_type:complete